MVTIKHIGLFLGGLFCTLTIYLFIQESYPSSLISSVLAIIFFIIEIGEYHYQEFRKVYPICKRYILSDSASQHSKKIVHSCLNCALNRDIIATFDDIVEISTDIEETPTVEEETEEAPLVCTINGEPLKITDCQDSVRFLNSLPLNMKSKRQIEKVL